MENKLFIPEKIKVGYQERDDTYTKRLAYVIYYDNKGVLRKEKSWEGWRNKKIKADEFENKPHSGFVLNKGVQRYGEWGSGRNMVRVYDDRGIEFEITVSNLMFILMTTDCLKRGLEGEFVYAWHGTELVLLPTGCEEYQESKDFTKLQTKKVGVKDLVPGGSYKTKRMEDLIYLGRFDWYEMEYTNKGYVERAKPKRFIFREVGDSYRKYRELSGLSSLAAVNSDVPVSNYAELMDEFNKTGYAAPVVALEHVAATPDLTKEDQWGHSLKGSFFIPYKEGYASLNITKKTNYQNNKFLGYSIYASELHVMEDGRYMKKWIDSNERDLNKVHGGKKDEYGHPLLSLDELKALNFVKPRTILANGKKGKIDKD